MALTKSQLVMLTQVRRLDLIARYKAKVGCSRCSENDPHCLDFHHRDPTEKLPKLTKVKGSGRSYTGGSRWADLSYAEIVAEIAKCDVLCSNCHRKESARQFPRRAAVSVKRSPKLRAAEIALGLA